MTEKEPWIKQKASSIPQRHLLKNTVKQPQRSVTLKSHPQTRKSRPVTGRVSKVVGAKEQLKRHEPARHCSPILVHHRPQAMSSRKSMSWKSPQPSARQLIETLKCHGVNTLTELVRIERIAATTPSPADAQAFQSPMTAAWVRYVTSNQLTTELRNLTPNWPFAADLVSEAHVRVLADPLSNRSWNLAWLILTKMKEDGLIAVFAGLEAAKPEMWGGRPFGSKDVARLATFFEMEWDAAVGRMLRHWPRPPTWF